MTPVKTTTMTHFRWVICGLLFLATTVNYMDRQVLSLTWKDFIAPEFHWTDANYGKITAYFSIFYAIANLFAGKFIDWMGTKKGYLIAIFVWSLGACLHAGCGWAAMEWEGYSSVAQLGQLTGDAAVMIATVSMYLFLACRMVLALGEAGNFPAAIKVTAEYFPKKDRAFATSIFNSGASVGALAAPATIPLLARAWGWELAFIIIGVLGFVWMGLWIWLYDKPHRSSYVNQAELNYIEQDNDIVEVQDRSNIKEEKTIPFWKCFTFRQTWSFIVGKLFTDGVWWFFLFWAPAYFSDHYFVEKRGMNPYLGRMRAMLIFACLPLLGLFAQPLGTYSAWWPAILIGLLGAGHQAWSANLYSTIGDMFPKSTIGTITGIGTMAGGLGSYAINLCSGEFFDWAAAQGSSYTFFGFEGKPAAYMVVFCICAVAYLIGWCIMKTLVPKYKPIIIEE